jgi:hypothetical protein
LMGVFLYRQSPLLRSLTVPVELIIFICLLVLSVL